MRKFILFVATGAGTGYSPAAPGTAGAALGLVLWALLAAGLGLPTAGLVLTFLVVSVLGVWAAGRAEPLLGRKDDGRITIDEVAGMLLALLLLPVRLDVALLGFGLFRLFDIWKPFPVGLGERLSGGLGVMADDWLAGLYANLGGQLLWRLALPGGLW